MPTTRHTRFAFRDYGNKELLLAAKAGLDDSSESGDLAAQFEQVVGQLRAITQEMALVAQAHEDATPTDTLLEVNKVIEELETAAGALVRGD